MPNIYLDIETIPSQLPWVSEYVAAGVKCPGTIKKEESIAKWHEESKPDAILEAMEKCSFDGALNHIVCIGIAIDDENPMAVVATNIDQEKDLLEAFYIKIKDHALGAVYIGHNISGFDLKIIKQRSMVLGVKPTGNIPFDAKPWEKNPYDTMVQWDSKNSAKLDKIARAFGLEGKGEVDGSDVYPMWKAGKFDEISAYCKDDVALTRAVYKKMNFIGVSK